MDNIRVATTLLNNTHLLSAQKGQGQPATLPDAG